ncbi:MAG TPA: choice-of-anchor R domain-containing protein [Verrucomicrobiota bacterium]|nr:choice-of-anchor R domain-containing protein [Verrucomicrobiota bacterium]HNU52738.1 choice-of-anchor R domain-containing protein [Verrucomicrobiota bacterium]
MSKQPVTAFTGTLLAALCLGSSAAFAASTVVSNIGEPVAAAYPIKYSVWEAQPFVVGDLSYTLDGISAVVGSVSGNPTVVAQLRYADPATYVIGNDILTTFAVPDLSGAPSARLFTPDSPVTLNPNTAYYFLLGVSSAEGEFAWTSTQMLDHTGPGDIPGYGSESTDGGATWKLWLRVPDYPYVWQPQQLEVTGTAQVIPEPGILSLLLLGSGILVWRHRR